MAKKKAANPRRGRVKKGPDNEPAQFEPGSAAAPKNFDVAEIADEARLWWEQDGGDNYIIQSTDELWSKWTKDAIVKELKSLPGRWLVTSTRAGEQISETDRVLQYVRKQRCVEEVLPALAGYKAGVRVLPDGRRVIIRMSPRLVEPKKGEWPTIRALIEGRLNLAQDGGSGVDQSNYFHAWCKVACESLMFGEPGSYKSGHALVMAGAAGCGKSRLQINIITPLLGGRAADPTTFLNGEDIFNADMMGAEHLMMEELLTGSQKSVDRAALKEAMKRLIVNESKRMRLMKTDPISVNPFWRYSLTMNNDPDTLRAFPILSGDFKDKVLMLLVAKRPMPMETRTVAQQKAFNDTCRNELPAYVHWLLHEFEIPEEWLVDGNGEDATRFGFCSYQHPELAMGLFDDTPAAKLLALIDAAEFTAVYDGGKKSLTVANRKLWELVPPYNKFDLDKHNQWLKQRNRPLREAAVWRGSAEELTDLLIGENEKMSSTVVRAAKSLLRHGDFDRLLGRLAEAAPDRVIHGRTGQLGRYWEIGRPPQSRV